MLSSFGVMSAVQELSLGTLCEIKGGVEVGFTRDRDAIPSLHGPLYNVE